jgi:hypothetical protein
LDDDDDDDFLPVEIPAEAPPAATAKPVPAEQSTPFADNPRGSSEAPARGDKPAGPRRADEKDEKPAKAKRREEEGTAAPKKKRKSANESAEPPKSKAQPAPRANAGGSNPFAAFSSEPAGTEKSATGRDDDGPEGPRYHRPAKTGGTGKMLLISAVVGLFALGLGVTAVVVYVKSNKKNQEQAKKEEKKEEAPALSGAPTDAQQPKGDSPAKGDPKSKDKNPDSKAPKDPEPEPGARPTLALRGMKAFNVGALPAKVEPVDKPQAGMVLDVPLTAVRRVFTPPKPKTDDTCVLFQTAAGAGGKGEKLALDSYGPAGNRVPAARIEYEGDGLAVPIADLHTTPKGTFFLAAVGGKLHVWALADKSKLADGISPYADKPLHAKAGLAAAFFSREDPNLVVTVSTAGAVLLYDLSAKKAVSEFVPPNGAPGKVALGQSIAVADGHGSVAVAVAGVLYQVRAAPELEVLRKYDLGGDVGRSIALAVHGTPGRLLYVFETAPDRAGKKEKAILGLPLGDEAKPVFYKFPDAAGEPKAALWANEAGGVVVDRGVLWFNDDEGKFLPLLLTQPPAGGQYFGDEKYFWYLIPHPKEATKSALVALVVPFADFAQYQKNSLNQPLRAAKIDHNGLAH